MNMMEDLKDKPWHQLQVEEAVQLVGVDLSDGLALDEVTRRHTDFDPNRVTALSARLAVDNF